MADATDPKPEPEPVKLTSSEMVRHYIQQMLNNAGDGWHLAQYVLCMGLERVDSDGNLQCTAWVWAPNSQADWMTDGLLTAAMDLRQTCLHDDD